MEKMNLQLLSLFLDTDIVVVPGENHAFVKPHETGDGRVDPAEETDGMDDEIPTIAYEGGFEKGILVVHDESELRKELHEMLFNLFGALQCSLKDIALVRSADLEGLPMESLLDLAPSKVVVFGLVRHDLMAFQKNKYETIQEEGIEYLFADSLSLMSENKELKKQLWKEIQVMFNIKK